MIVTLAAIAAVATAMPQTADAEPLDDLSMMAVLAEIAAEAVADGEADLLLDAYQGETGGSIVTHAPQMLSRHAYARDVEAARRGTLSPVKATKKPSAPSFNTTGSGWVSMPGPGGAFGRIAADALSETDGLDAEGASVPGAGPVGGLTDGTHTAAATLDEGTLGGASTGGGPVARIASATQAATVLPERSSQTVKTGTALRFSLAEPAPAPAEDQAPLPTPVPPSLLLFASGLGLLTLSRRKANA